MKSAGCIRATTSREDRAAQRRRWQNPFVERVIGCRLQAPSSAGGGASGVRTMKINVPRTRSLECQSAALQVASCSILVPRDRNVVLARAPTTRATAWNSRRLLQPRWEGYEPAASPRVARTIKKPGPAKYSESGRNGAEHRIRTGDLRLGKALQRMCMPMQRESSRRNLKRLRDQRERQLCKLMQPESTALLTLD